MYFVLKRVQTLRVVSPHQSPLINDLNLTREATLSKQSWHTYLHRVSPNRPWNSGVLLRSSHTPCIECLKHEENRYIGGVFYLLQGDIIQICLSNPDIDNFNSETSFVGFFKLAS
ncbi:hypothetical protein Btru_073721 [Bulinus truncatus]|nr:hypothetical protein Btru_073721 [Bulinus truncatus]